MSSTPATMPAFADDLAATLRNRSLIRRKKFLERLYRDWYGVFLQKIPSLPAGGKMLELGSGGGFLKELCPAVITSDVLPLEHCDRRVRAEALPFGDGELSAIFMIDVLHHIPQCELFFGEAERTLRTGGLLLMIEPASTFVSRLFYRCLHREGWDASTADWSFPSAGPLSGANGALPWVVFHRDIHRFHRRYPSLKVDRIQLHTPFLYPLSGGMTRLPSMPAWSYDFFKNMEKWCAPAMKYIAMFETIEIRKG